LNDLATASVTKRILSAIQAAIYSKITTEIVMKKQSEQQKQRTNNLVKKNFASKIRRQKLLAERAKTASGG